MATITTRPAADEVTPAAGDASGQRFLLSGVSWQFYERVLAELRNRPIRVTYDRGNLEFMAPSYRHEVTGHVLGIFVEVLAEESNQPVRCAGSTTLRREEVDRGLEPDQCFYIGNFDRIRGRTDLDLSNGPPPDLAIEVDVTRSSLDRMSIYAALGIPEVWRYRGDTVRVFLLKDNGRYEEQAASLLFPHLEMEKLVEFLRLIPDNDDTAIRRSFREWLRREILPNQPG